jgi:RNA ligase (TIGR02306 family)
MRKMASIRKIDDIRPIEGADAIECAVVGGWNVVVKKGEFAVGDLAVYCEIDSWIPTELAPFLSKGKEPREYEGVKGERLRTIKLRGQVSQGLLLPVDHVDGVPFITGWHHEDGIGTMVMVVEGQDITECLNIQKWEAPISAQLAGQAKGTFPTSLIPKTDQERVQNLVKEIAAAAESGAQFEVTEKLEGSSMTCYVIRGEFGVCSRNLDLKRDENNTFWKVAIEEGIEEKMRRVGAAHRPYGGFAIQGELIGPGIQGNIYKLSKPEFRVFDVYDIQEGKYLNPADRRELVDCLGLKHVPVLLVDKDVLINDVQEILTWAEGKSKLNENQEREGIVFKEVNGGMTFKAISNKYLLGEK